MVSLKDYREKRITVLPKIEITLLPSGGVDFDTSHFRDEDAFQGLIGCYVVAGKLLQTLSDRMRRCGTNGGPPE